MLHTPWIPVGPSLASLPCHDTVHPAIWAVDYCIGDTVRFTSTDPYRIQITGRTAHFINAFGEELIIENAEEALQAACEKTNSEIKDYTVGPIFMNEDSTGGAHEWIIEFKKPPQTKEQVKQLMEDEMSDWWMAGEIDDYDIKNKLMRVGCRPLKRRYLQCKKMD